MSVVSELAIYERAERLACDKWRMQAGCGWDGRCSSSLYQAVQEVLLHFNQCLGSQLRRIHPTRQPFEK